MTSIPSLPVIRSLTADDRTSAARADGTAAATAQAAVASTTQDIAPATDEAGDQGAHRNPGPRTIDQRIDALVRRQPGDQRISADQADELKQLLAGTPAAAGGDAVGSDSTASASGSTSFGDQLDALSKSLDKLRASLTRQAAYGAGAGGDGGLVFDRLA